MSKEIILENYRLNTETYMAKCTKGLMARGT